MKMQIVSCPHCGTYLLDDSSQCHGCGHALDNQFAKIPSLKKLPTDNAVREDMEACPSCGEACRTGLVRCWNCSSFLRPEIEARYRRMQEVGKVEIEHVDLPILDASIVTEQDSYQRRSSTPESYLASRPFALEDVGGGDDFDLSSDAQFGEADDLSFDLDNSMQLTEQIGESDDLEVFRLQEPLDEPPVRAELIEPLLKVESGEPPIPTEIDEPPGPMSDEPISNEQVAESKSQSEAAGPSPEEELLKIAADEEKDIQRVRKTLRSKDTFVIFCPQGHRIRVKEKFRGKSGKCPKCESEFVVPRKQVPKKADASVAASTDPIATSRYKKWLNDIRLHSVDPTKLRIKADSLLNECQPVDIGFSAEDLIVVTLVAGKFGANPKKVPPIRQALIEHFAKQGTFEQLVAVAKKHYSHEVIGQFAVAQPTPAGTESLFHDIPVFGTNRIAIRIPKTPDVTHPQYLSFWLSEFRAFAEALQSACGIEGFGSHADIPLTDEYATFKCHLSEAKVQELAKVNYYEKDPGFKLEVAGWRCAQCGIVVSEAARAAAKLGGANGKGLAKAKCPKCTLKFGNVPLYQLAGSKTEAPAESPDAEAVTAE